MLPIPTARTDSQTVNCALSFRNAGNGKFVAFSWNFVKLLKLRERKFGDFWRSSYVNMTNMEWSHNVGRCNQYQVKIELILTVLDEVTGASSRSDCDSDCDAFWLENSSQLSSSKSTLWFKGPFVISASSILLKKVKHVINKAFSVSPAK